MPASALENSALPAWFVAGGPAMWLLAVLSVVSLAVLLSKVVQFLRTRPLATPCADTALAALVRGDRQAADAALADAATPGDKVIGGALALARPGVSASQWQEEVLRQARAELESLRGGLRLLEVVGTLAPLIGLLGTVFGMISAFQQLEMAGSQVDPALLSGGIWEALLTTAAGLVVAIPALAAFHWCDRTIEQSRHTMEDRLARLRVALNGNLTSAAEAKQATEADPAHAY
ncbi:MotA/TolQ/ExbB proton channel family protein [Alcanivorax sp. JB21]|uniref:MotA/TolQ/ExbB proton channel family protein n=1 Tax=Alcanivorax limicola TaxID=2874102 RepID=UPI001CC09ED1|nr:MotA/TolQ/ExbB proton channel family protein [Alcanivorax limicola]MBZ2190014.1 MotA/TolQ/ExbB proton channel family protein [Alcanivorax limicola]